MNVKGVFSCCNEAFRTGNFGGGPQNCCAEKCVTWERATLPRAFASLSLATILRDCQQSIFESPSITRNRSGCGVGVIEGMERGGETHFTQFAHSASFEKGTGPRKLSQRLLVLFLWTGEKWPIAVWRVPSNDSNSLFVSKAANAHSFDINFYYLQSTSVFEIEWRLHKGNTKCPIA